MNFILQIDFQFCFYGSPAPDIYWALYFVASNETRDNHRQELISLYHAAFVDTLNKLGFLKTPPSLLDLNIELLKNGVLGIRIDWIILCWITFSYKYLFNCRGLCCTRTSAHLLCGHAGVDEGAWRWCWRGSFDGIDDDDGQDVARGAQDERADHETATQAAAPGLIGYVTGRNMYCMQPMIRRSF